MHRRDLLKTLAVIPAAPLLIRDVFASGTTEPVESISPTAPDESTAPTVPDKHSNWLEYPEIWTVMGVDYLRDKGSYRIERGGECIAEGNDSLAGIANMMKDFQVHHCVIDSYYNYFVVNKFALQFPGYVTTFRIAPINNLIEIEEAHFNSLGQLSAQSALIHPEWIRDKEWREGFCNVAREILKRKHDELDGLAKAGINWDNHEPYGRL